MTSENSKLTKPGHGGLNLRSLAFLFKCDLNDMFNTWSEEKPIRSGYPHASSILVPNADFCLRKLVLLAEVPDQAERPTKSWDAHQNAVFLNGWMLHEKYQNLLKKFGRVVYYRGQAELDLTHFDEKHLIYFSPDAIVMFEGEAMIVEIKGYKANTFEKLNEAGPAPVDAHKQANLYMHLLGLKHALILVENKDTQQIKVWCVEYDLEMIQTYLDRIASFKAALARVEEELPARICKTSCDRNAEKCPVRAVCFGLKGK